MSIYYMLATLASVAGGFCFVVLRACRKAKRSGQAFQPEGKLRWTDEPPA
jgi:hypothetical protein